MSGAKAYGYGELAREGVGEDDVGGDEDEGVVMVSWLAV